MDIIKDLNEKEGLMFTHRLLLFVFLFNVLIIVIGVSFIVSIGKTLQSDEMQRPNLSVTGEGKLFVRPDIARFTATVVTDGAHVGDAQNQNSHMSGAAIDFLKKQGVQDKDIKTITYSVEPQYQYDNRPPLCSFTHPSVVPCPVNTPPRIVSYEVRNSVEIKVRDLNKIDDLLQGVVSAGANEVGSVTFTVEDEKAAMANARRQAIEDAQAKAVVLARDLGVRIKKIVGFSESGGGPIYYGRALEAQVSGEGTPPVQPGEQEIRSNVTITYEFR